VKLNLDKPYEEYSKEEKKEMDKKKLTYKVIKLDGFSIFCDWIDIGNPERGAF
jgi:hypothetical protein